MPLLKLCSLHCVLKASFWLTSILPFTLARSKFSWCRSSVAKSHATLWLHGLPPPGSSVHESSRQEHWSGLPFPPPGDLPDPGIEPPSPALVSRFSTIEPLGKPIQVLSPVQTLFWLFQSTRNSLFSKFLSITSLTGCFLWCIHTLFSFLINRIPIMSTQKRILWFRRD